MERLLEPAYAPRVGTARYLALSRIRDEGLLVCVVGVYVAVLCWRIASHLQQDGWLMFAAGRDIVTNGLPNHDHLTYWTAGVHWIDQQWLAQVMFYGLASAGGLKLALFVHALFLVATFVLVVALARWQGASARATAWTAVLAVIPVVSGSWQMRAQTLGLFFFALLLWLIVSDQRVPSRRVYLVLPLLALWANVHGSVVVGAVFVALYALTSRRLAITKAAILLVGAAASVLATPYGLGMLDYYRTTLLNPGFSEFVTEWQPTTLQPLTAPFYVLILGGIWLLASRGGRVGGFQKMAFLAGSILALLAVRNIAFLGLTALVALPPALDDVLPRRRTSRRLDSVVVGVAAALVLLSFPVAWHSISKDVQERFPAPAAAKVAQFAEQEPTARIVSDVKFADWLLWERPELAGRIAYDARFELLSDVQLQRIFNWTNQQTARWKAAVQNARLIILDLEVTKLNEKALLAEPGVRVLYRDSEISVLERPARTAP